jgi:hypothetical protein
MARSIEMRALEYSFQICVVISRYGHFQAVVVILNGRAVGGSRSRVTARIVVLVQNELSEVFEGEEARSNSTIVAQLACSASLEP